MKRPLIALLLLACLPLLYGQKTRYGQEPPTAKPGVDYLVKVHISGIRIRRYCDQGICDDVLHADAVLSQQKVELTGSFIYTPRFFQDSLVPGDYTARLLKVAHKGAAVPLYDEYELLLPDRHVWRCTVTGMSE
jgi:hypothetical protein